MIRDRICQIQENINRVCQKVGRNPLDITVVVATKYASAAEIREVIAAGIKHIGENRVQDAEQKFAQLGELANKVTKHMVGHLQTNKAKEAVKVFDMIQSVDSEKLVLEIEKRAAAQDKASIPVLIEVNSGEEQKNGILPAELMGLVEKVAACPHISLCGLMTMAPLTQDKELVRKSFRNLRISSEQIARQFKGHPRVAMQYLSMGMTDDYEIAIEEGSNMVRIGRAIFQD